MECEDSQGCQDDRKKSISEKRRASYSAFNALQLRKESQVMTFPTKEMVYYASRKLPLVLQPKDFDLGRIDKIFASQWLDERNVVFGTKCNKLKILNTFSGKHITIPMIQGQTPSSDVTQNSCGIHSLEINPSGTLLATGGQCTHDLAIYKLPEFDPLCLGEMHTDWIFGIVWLNDKIVATGSRDGCLGIWDVSHAVNLEKSCNNDIERERPIAWLNRKKLDKRYRAVQYNPQLNELASLSTEAVLHIWDPFKLKTIRSVKLPYQLENVCLSLEPQHCLYAVGSQSHVTMLDGRSPSNHLYSVESIDKDAGIRSLSFHNELVTIGTGFGSCSFLDLKTKRFIQTQEKNVCQLKAKEGFRRHDEVYHTLFGEMCLPTSIYTHCYDQSGSKLFTGGGPLAVGLYGNYAALWQ